MVGTILLIMSLFSPKQEECLRYLQSKEFNHVTEVFFGGAAGGGKSWLGSHWQIARRLQYPGTRGCIGRSQLKNLKRTTLKTFSDVWNEYYANNPMKITYQVNQQDGIMYFSNGSEIVLQDLFAYPSDEDFTALGSLEITDAFIDEAPEIGQKAFEILQSRIRYRLINDTPKILLTGNPQSNWVKWRYVKGQNGKAVELLEYQKYVQSLVLDNPNQAFKDAYVRQLEKLSPYDRERLLNGSWDVIDSDNSAFYGYSEQKHFTNEPYEVSNDHYLDISFDFNINPCTAIIGQYDVNKTEWHVFDIILANTSTFAGMSPLQAVCKQIKHKYLDTGRVIKNRIRVTGDASGKNGSADKQESRSFYYTICRELEIDPKQLRVRGANTTHVYSTGVCNYALTTLPDLVLNFHNTFELTDDIRHAYMEDRSLDKAKKEHGLHVLDAWRYLMDFWFSFHSQQFVTNDKQVQVFIDSVAKRKNG